MTEQSEAQPAQIPPEQIQPHQTELLRRYTTDTGKILPRKYTHLTAKQQRTIARTIKRARNLQHML